MKNKLICISIILSWGTTVSFAQTDSLFWNGEMLKIATPTSNANWINIQPGISIRPSRFLLNTKKHYGLEAMMK